MNQITITVTGTTRSGKSTIKYQIAKHLEQLGLKVNIIENELTEKAVENRRHNPNDYIKSINERNTTINIEEKQLHRNMA